MKAIKIMKSIGIKIFFLSLLATLAVSFAQPAQAKGRLKVGLVLGGGGAKGAAEIGTLKAIEELGIPVDYIAGTSIGSIVGGLYSTGCTPEQIDTLFRSQEWADLLSDRKAAYKGALIKKEDSVTYVLGFPVFRKGKSKAKKKGFGAIRGDNIIALLDSMTGRKDSMDFDKLPIPFRCVAVDAGTMKEVVLKSGKLPIAMRASMAIPGVFKPVLLDSLTLVDGGMLNNLPVDVVKEMGADVVIAVDLTQNKHKTKDKGLPRGKGLRKIIEWAITRPDLRKYNVNRMQADVYINPNLKGYSAADFKPEKISEMIERGEKAAKKSRKKLKELKEKIYQ